MEKPDLRENSDKTACEQELLSAVMFRYH